MSKSSVLDSFLEPVASFLTPEVAERLVAFRADDETQARLDDLAEKSNEGRLSEQERRDYETYVAAIDFITVLQSKARRLLKRREAP